MDAAASRSWLDEDAELKVWSERGSDPLVACLSYCLRDVGIPAGDSAIIAGLPVESGRLTPSGALRAATRLGASAALSKRSFPRINAIVLPAIALLADRDACVIISFDDKARTAEVYWPSRSDDVFTVDQRQLEQLYIGASILFKRDEIKVAGSGAAERTGKHWFWSTLSRYTPAYLQIVLAAALINILALASPLFIMNVYDRVFPNAAMSTLWVMTAAVAIAFLFDMLLKIVRAVTVDAIGRRIDILLSSQLFDHVANLKLEAQPNATGALLNHLKDYEHLRDFFSSATIVAFTDLMFIFILIGIVYVIGGPLFWIPVGAAAAVLIITLMTRLPLIRASEAAQETAAAKNVVAVETLGALESVKALTAEGRMLRGWEMAVAQSSATQAAVRFWSMLGTTLSGFAMQATSVAVVIGGVYLASEGLVTMGAVIACVILSGRVVQPLGQIATTVVRGQYALSTLRKLNQIMDSPRESGADASYIDRPVTEGRIKFDRTTFSYPQASSPALAEVSFSIDEGEKVGVIGRIGSGKSSLCRLVAGLYTPQGGEVLIDGVDIRQHHPRALRRSVGMVPQEVVLFSGTLRENIAFAKPEASDTEIVEIAELVGVTEIASRHPSGYDMPIVERGRNLSGGQRQLVGLARALILNPRILVLDEPTSSMDAATERMFTQCLHKIVERRKITLVLSTHRSSMLGLVDRLMVLEKGRLVADGPKAKVIAELKKAAGAGSPGLAG